MFNCVTVKETCLASKLEASEAKNTELAGKYSEALDENDKFQAKLEESEAKNSNILEENRKLKDRVEVLENKMTALKQGFKDRAEKIRLDLVELETSRSQPSTQDPAALTHFEDNEVSEQSSSLLDCAVNDNTTENDNNTEDVTDSNNLFLPSDEEFDDLNFAVGNTIVKHYLNPRELTLESRNCSG